MDKDHTTASLGKSYPSAQVNGGSHMKDRILHEATLLFAERGVADVSIKEIARQVGLQPASLYNHFESKDALWEAVLANAESLYLEYFARLDKAGEGAASFHELLETMFVELKRVVSIFTYYGFSLILTEQFHDRRAERVFLNTFGRFSIDYIAERFDRCVSKGWARPFDTRTAATILMNTVMQNMHLRVHEHLGHTVPYDITAMYEGLQRFILSVALPAQ